MRQQVLDIIVEVESAEEHDYSEDECRSTAVPRRQTADFLNAHRYSSLINLNQDSPINAIDPMSAVRVVSERTNKEEDM